MSICRSYCRSCGWWKLPLFNSTGSQWPRWGAKGSLLHWETSQVLLFNFFQQFCSLTMIFWGGWEGLAAAFVYIVSFVLCSNQYQDYFSKCLLPFGERLLTMTDIEGLVSGFVNNKGPTCLQSLWVKCSLCRIQWNDW